MQINLEMMAGTANNGPIFLPVRPERAAAPLEKQALKKRTGIYLFVLFFLLPTFMDPRYNTTQRRQYENLCF